MMVFNGSTIVVRHLGDSQFSISIRGHDVIVDQPLVGGGEDAGPTPTQLFVASLAACAASHGRSFLHARGLPDQIDATARWSMDLRPTRVTRVAIQIVAPGLPADKEDAFLRAVEHCTVHNSLIQRPEVSIRLAPEEEHDGHLEESDQGRYTA